MKAIVSFWYKTLNYNTLTTCLPQFKKLVSGLWPGSDRQRTGEVFFLASYPDGFQGKRLEKKSLPAGTKQVEKETFRSVNQGRSKPVHQPKNHVEAVSFLKRRV
ncbi:hypothetical protein ACFPMF_09210 [Larkinella bovis]|uniref:Uncharacterized protein n=1 Tax=Larkinella bovis TaxID=683041 RepID=A0ABW0I7V0_9BACT